MWLWVNWHMLACCIVACMRGAPPVPAAAAAGVVTAYVFTWIPEWTTWVLLIAMAIYDVVAVLVPGG